MIILVKNIKKSNKNAKTKKLEGLGISARVINISCAKPIDRKMIIESARKTNAIITVESHNIIGGVGKTVLLKAICDNGGRFIANTHNIIKDNFMTGIRVRRNSFFSWVYERY